MLGEKAIKRTEDDLERPVRQAQFERVWQQHRARIWRLLARLAGNVDLADDLTQEVSVRAFQAFDSFRGRCSEFTWLYRIAVNVAHRDRERRRESLALDAPAVARICADEAQGPEQAALKADLSPVVCAALERLPDDLRITLILQVYEELKYREIAVILDIPIGTVKSRLHAAMQRLREELKDYVL